jgi:hypothetical protein
LNVEAHAGQRALIARGRLGETFVLSGKCQKDRIGLAVQQ